MTKYFFDMREADLLALDEEGLDLPSMEAAQMEAARSLADYIKIPEVGADVLDGIAVEVRDEAGLVLTVQFKIQHQRSN